LELRLRGKSTAQSHRSPVYYVDLVTRTGTTLASTLAQAKSLADERLAAGFDQAALDQTAREGLAMSTPIQSDCAALNGLVTEMLAAVGEAVHVLRDPTRGGVATTIKEIALQSDVTITLNEAAIPLNPTVKGFCSILGLDPLYVANEGKLIAIVATKQAEAVLAAMRNHPLGKNAAKIGMVQKDAHHFVQMNTRFGGRRIVDWLTGEQLPRIC
jgi:hydrogenase expression/formation protein HypE